MSANSPVGKSGASDSFINDLLHSGSALAFNTPINQLPGGHSVNTPTTINDPSGGFTLLDWHWESNVLASLQTDLSYLFNSTKLGLASLSFDGEKDGLSIVSVLASGGFFGAPTEKQALAANPPVTQADAFDLLHFNDVASNKLTDFQNGVGTNDIPALATPEGTHNGLATDPLHLNDFFLT